MFEKKSFWGVSAFTLCVVSTAFAAGGTLTVGTVSAAPGASVAVPVTLAAGGLKDISTLQFDLVLPPGVTSSDVKPAAASTAAGKSVSSAKVAEGLRVIVFGLNQTPMASGDVVTIQLNLPKTVTAKSLPLEIKNMVLSNEKGKKIEVKGKPGSIKIGATVATGS